MPMTADLGRRALRELQELVAISLDSSRGFAEAAEMVESPEIAAHFRRCGERLAVHAAEIQSALDLSGLWRSRSEPLSGSVHRWWEGLREGVLGYGEYAMLSTVERAEEDIERRYRSALRDSAGSPVNATLTRQYASVHQDHDTLQGMRDARG